jgi:hypothetical protein
MGPALGMLLGAAGPNGDVQPPSQAIFLILWTPVLERQTTCKEGAPPFRHRSLSYWLDYVRTFAGTDASVLIIQSQCDTRDKRLLHPPAPVDDFPFHRYTEVSARTGLNLGILKETIKETVRDLFDRRPPTELVQHKGRYVVLVSLTRGIALR